MLPHLPTVNERALSVELDLGARAIGYARSERVQSMQVTDEAFMNVALDEARKAQASGEVPVGAIVVIESRIVGAGFNQPIASNDPTAHAEVVAVREAARAVGNYRLIGATLYVTVEPCMMCVGAMVHARVDTVVYGTAEPKAGALVSAQFAHEAGGLNHRLKVRGGVCEDECRALIQAFFKERRS